MSIKQSRPGRTAQKQRTRRLILEAAAKLIADGKQPTVTEAADAAAVSRRTAYRYFPSHEKLLADASLEGVRPTMEAMLANAPTGETESELEARIMVFVRSVQKEAFRNEQLLRTMVHATVLESPQAVPRRGGRRIDWIESALAPLRGRLSATTWERLVSGFSLCIGIEAMLVLKDIRGLSRAESINVSEWCAMTLLQAALQERPLLPAGRRAISRAPQKTSPKRTARRAR